MRRLATPLIVLVAVAAPLRMAWAVNNLLPQQQQAWSEADRCMRESFIKFPDQTKQGQEERRKYVRNCQIQRSRAEQLPLILRD